MSYYGGNTGNTTGGGGNFYGQQQQQQQGGGGFSSGGGAGNSGGFANSNNMQQWQAQPQQQQQPQQQHQQYGQQLAPQQQQQQQQPSFFGSVGGGAAAASAPSLWNPAAAATLAAASLAAGSAGLSQQDMLGAGFDIGESLFQKGTARMIPGLETTMLSLRSYFAVDNHYVVVKMKKILFPFLPSSKFGGWKRQQQTGGTNKYTPDGSMIAMPQYNLPIADVNAPDLYLPTMSLITYVLLCALCYGNAGQFNPEIIPNVTTKCIVTQILEVLCIRFIGFYMMQISPSTHAGCPTMLDLCSYTGYKYLGLCINMIIGLLVSHFGFGARAFYVTFLWTATAASFTMLKIMANNLPQQHDSGGNVMMSGSGGGGGPKREVMVLVFGASQFATMWFVSQTKFL